MQAEGTLLPRTTSLPKIPLLLSASPEIDPVSERSPSPAATSSEGQSTSSATENTECVVCGDKSSGKHYGQYSCEGCKSFFKRSIRRALNYTCRGTKQCPVDVHHRNQCQYCRLRKCVKMGMRKEAVQRGRIPPSMPLPPFFPLIHPHFLNPLMNSFLRPEPRTLPILEAADSVGEFGAQLLFSVIDWTKQLPFFAELCLSDQIILLQNSWSQLFMLCASQSPLPPTVASDLMNLRPKQDSSKSESMDDVSGFQAQLELIRGLHLDVAEMNCVKAAVLFNPDTTGLIDKPKVESVQEKIQASLDDYCRSHKALMTGRFGRILLRLPAVRSFSPLLVERLFFSGLPSPVAVVVKDLLQQPSVPRWPLLPPFFQLPLPFLG